MCLKPKDSIMRKLSEYNLTKLIMFLCTVSLLGGALIGMVGSLFKTNLFEIYIGFPGFLFISLLVLIILYYLKKYDSWLIK